MNLALFDFDGTITRGDSFTNFLRFAGRPRRLAVGQALLAPVAVAYRLGAVSASRARPLVARVVFQGESAEFVNEHGRRYASEVLPKMVRTEAVDRIRWHQQQGDRVVEVSASLDSYLAPWCGEIGVERISTELEERNGRLTGRYRHGDCSGSTKARRIVEEYDLGRYGAVFAYGDTIEDREMLELADRKFYRGAEIRNWQEAVRRGVAHPAS